MPRSVTASEISVTLRGTSLGSQSGPSLPMGPFVSGFVLLPRDERIERETSGRSWEAEEGLSSERLSRLEA